MRSYNIKPLIAATEDKLLKNFNFSLNLDGIDDVFKEIDKILEFDIENLQKLNKKILMWYSYLSEVQPLIEFFIDRFKNTIDVYDYLDFLSREDISLFSSIAPKYKINTRDTVSAMIELGEKRTEMTIYVRNLKAMNKILLSYINFFKSHHYKTNQLINKNGNRLIRAGF